jgi:hypothetical protein
MLQVLLFPSTVVWSRMDVRQDIVEWIDAKAEATSDVLFLVKQAGLLVLTMFIDYQLSMHDTQATNSLQKHTL